MRFEDKSALILALIIGISAAHSPAAIGASPAVDQTLQGVLRVGKDQQSILEAGGKPWRLESSNKHIAATLKDDRLSGRELKVIGTPDTSGSFNVHEFYVVREGRLYRVIYFCEVCNITTFSPGNCLCCQQPTVPVEVSPTDPRIYHDEIKGPPP